jgi:hypothetical protein
MILPPYVALLDTATAGPLSAHNRSRILTADGCEQRCAGLAVQPFCTAVHAPPLLSKACSIKYVEQ